MRNLVKVFNERTGKDEYQFVATLKSELSSNTLQNSNGTEYKLCTIEFPNKDGEMIERSASVFAGNYNHPDADFEIGKDYLATLQIADNGNRYIHLSHLNSTGANLATEDDFDLSQAVEKKAKATVIG